MLELEKYMGDGSTSSYTGTDSRSTQSRPISIKKPATSSKYEMPQDDSPPAIVDNYEDDFGQKSPEIKKTNNFGIQSPEVKNKKPNDFGWEINKVKSP